jgi:hypothetical protein
MKFSIFFHFVPSILASSTTSGDPSGYPPVEPSAPLYEDMMHFGESDLGVCVEPSEIQFVDEWDDLRFDKVFINGEESYAVSFEEIVSELDDIEPGLPGRIPTPPPQPACGSPEQRKLVVVHLHQREYLPEYKSASAQSGSMGFCLIPRMRLRDTVAMTLSTAARVMTFMLMDVCGGALSASVIKIQSGELVYDMARSDSRVGPYVVGAETWVGDWIMKNIVMKVISGSHGGPYMDSIANIITCTAASSITRTCFAGILRVFLR